MVLGLVFTSAPALASNLDPPNLIVLVASELQELAQNIRPIVAFPRGIPALWMH